MTRLISPPPLCGTLLHPCPEVTWETVSVYCVSLPSECTQKSNRAVCVLAVSVHNLCVIVPTGLASWLQVFHNESKLCAAAVADLSLIYRQFVKPTRCVAFLSAGTV